MSNGEQATPVAPPRQKRTGLMGPAVLITIGVLFLIGQMDVGPSIRQLWPVLLIVIGLVKLYESVSGTKSESGS